MSFNPEFRNVSRDTFMPPNIDGKKQHRHSSRRSKVKFVAALHMIHQDPTKRIKFSSISTFKVPSDVKEYEKINTIKEKVLTGSLNKVYAEDSVLVRIPLVEWIMNLLGYVSLEQATEITKAFLLNVAYEGIFEDSYPHLELGIKILKGLEQTPDGRKVFERLQKDTELQHVHNALFYLFAIKHTHQEKTYDKFSLSPVSLRLALEIEANRVESGQESAYGEIAKILRLVSQSTEARLIYKELLKEPRFAELMDFYFKSAKEDLLRRHQSSDLRDKIELWARARDLFNLKDFCDYPDREVLEPIFRQVLRAPQPKNALDEMEVQTKEYLEKLEKNLLFLSERSFRECFEPEERLLFRQMFKLYAKHERAFKNLSLKMFKEDDPSRKAHVIAKAYSEGKDFETYLKTAEKLIKLSEQASKAFATASQDGKIARWYLNQNQSEFRHKVYRFFANGTVDPQSLELSMIVMQRLAKIPLQLAELKKQFGGDPVVSAELDQAIATLRSKIAKINARLRA